MPKTEPLPDWSGKDAFIIGGGASLRQFDFEQLEGRNTIGCNQAYLLGPAICQICIWGDYFFWECYQNGKRRICDGYWTNEKDPKLETFGGYVVTNYNRVDPKPPWLIEFRRLGTGLGGPGSGELAWNYNTGAAAANLALYLGARRIYLLGFDMQMGEGKSHWHDKSYENPTNDHYRRFIEGFQNVANEMPKLYPGTEIYNASPYQNLPMFGNIELEEIGLTMPDGYRIGKP